MPLFTELYNLGNQPTPQRHLRIRLKVNYSNLAGQPTTNQPQVDAIAKRSFPE
ncbi:MAG: hypothetical protein KME25_30005 [Symplocastrum torsivum CPER-KK1]|uniref:Uncharacterized protein n=1 Tax=Symplocastrum torsivum CPER-KK1 TaxID=450513 RepID=A0A951PRX1_9CYAN|nr:hypothetical protein [Symplocastrum torsivum CPER-KK1]